MSKFSYEQYQSAVAQAESNNNSPKIGYFKLKNDGDIAIARINIGSTEDLDFASVHTINIGGRWIKVSCLNPLGANSGECALCGAHNANPKGAVSKAAKKVFIPMMVSYRDPNAATGYTAPAPVIWDRPAMFSRELANKLMVAGDLRNTLVLITRNGKAGDMQTTYSMDVLPADHPVFKPEMIPADFTAFANFNIARHSYWEKTPEEINTYLTTGQFPERTQSNNQQTVNTVANVVNNTPGASFTAPTTPTPATVPVPDVPTATSNVTTPGVTTAVYSGTPVESTPVMPATDTTPVRNFSGFSF